jgi:hypothetical protein
MSIYHTLDLIVSDIIKTKRSAELKHNKELRRKAREAEKRNNPNRYYVYAFYREDDTPYYIGKGCGARMYRKRGKGETNPPSDRSRIKILEDNLTEEDAFDREKYYIALYGRKDNGTGILRNRCDGGGGAEGILGMSKLVENGTLHLMGKVSCVTHNGKVKLISKDIYHAQSGEPSNWKYVLSHSFEGFVRKQRKKGNTSSIEELKKEYGSTPCVNTKGEVIKISKEQFHNQSGTKSDKEYVTLNSTEGRRRLNIPTKSQIAVINKNGERVSVDKQIYNSQPSTKKLGVNLPTNQYVNPRSKEGQARIVLSEGMVKKSCGVSGHTYIININGDIKKVTKEEYQIIKKSFTLEWCALNSGEGKRRKHINKK